MRKLARPAAASPSTPTIVRAGTIRLLDEAGTVADALALLDGIIVKAGTFDECLEWSASRSTLEPVIVDFGESTIVPGFIDAHAHPLMLGQMMSWVDCGPERASDIPAIVALLREAAENAPKGQPVRGYGYEQRNLAEQRHPTRHELDQVSTTREVYLMNASGHGGVVNSHTLELNGITRDTPNPEGGEFFRTPAGDLTGELSDAACNILTGVHGVKIGHHGPNFHLGDEPHEHLRQLVAAQENFLSGGVTTIGDCQVTKREFDTYLRASAAGKLHTRISMYLLSHLLDDALELGITAPFGNEWMSIAGIKFYADGTLGGWTAYFPEGYVGDPCRTGQLYHDPIDYEAMIVKAHEAGLQTATHAQSPDALEMVISAIEHALLAGPDADARHRIEHCGLPTPDQIHRMATAGIYPVNQPQHYFNWGEGVEQAIGTPGERFNPLGEFVASGVPVTISSDAPVADPRPLEAVQAAVTRVTRRGAQLGDDALRIDIDTALRAHTIVAARALGREDAVGSLEIGKNADFAVLSEDPYTTDPAQLAQIRVSETWVGGVRRFVDAHANEGVDA